MILGDCASSDKDVKTAGWTYARAVCRYSVMDDGAVKAQVKVLFFAKAREITGTGEDRISVPRLLSYAELTERIISGFRLESIRDTLILAVNEEFVEPGATLTLSDKDEIAVIPPLSGG